MKRKLAFFGVLCLFVGFAVMALWLLREDPINQATYDQIRLGMTVKEVQAIFGWPGINFNDKTKDLGPGREALDMQEEGLWEERPDDNEPGRRRIWYVKDNVILIRFGQDDRVTDRFFARSKPLSYLERLRHLFTW